VTLGAALYFLPAFERERAGRSPAAAPMFVLDRQRLLPYSDEAGLFDNRYFAGLPAPQALQAAGIRHVLYVTPDQQVTMDADDLNGDLVALDQSGIDVKMLALSDFSETPLPGWLDDAPLNCPPASPVGPGPHYYFGGSPATQGCFSWWYGWQMPNFFTSGGRLAGIPASLAPRCRFQPTLRAPAATSGLHVGPGWRAAPLGPHVGFGRGGGGSMGRAHGGFGA